MKIIDLKKLFCKHEEIIWDKTKIMSYPEIYHGVCKNVVKNVVKLVKMGKLFGIKKYDRR